MNYAVKKRVFEAAFMSTLLCGCESWIGMFYVVVSHGSECFMWL